MPLWNVCGKSMKSMNEWKADVAVIGGGAAGMFAAGWAAQAGKKVVLIERNNRLGKKLMITGKGRCNVTNACQADEVLKQVPRNSRFLYSSLSAFPPEKTMAFFSEMGCPLKQERGDRVFPQSDQASSIVSALEAFLRHSGVQVIYGQQVQEIITDEEGICGLTLLKGTVSASCVILATGGCSYPLTGSDGSGYKLAEALGHTIVPPDGSLVSLVEAGHWCRQMQGLSLRNVAIKLVNQKHKVVYEDFGELLFTHFGLSGPTILSASAHMSPKDTYEIWIDLKPALDEGKLDARILRDFAQFQNRDVANALVQLYPRTLIPVMIQRAGIEPEQKVNSLTKQQRRALLELTKRFSVSIAGKRPVEEAIVTSGGVKVQEVDPKTMASKLVAGLYFAGEILDVDAYTGGFNLQIAWSTGYCAGTAAGKGR